MFCIFKPVLVLHASFLDWMVLCLAPATSAIMSDCTSQLQDVLRPRRVVQGDAVVLDFVDTLTKFGPKKGPTRGFQVFQLWRNAGKYNSGCGEAERGANTGATTKIRDDPARLESDGDGLVPDKAGFVDDDGEYYAVWYKRQNVRALGCAGCRMAALK
jgi:hypothetical protein